MSYLSDACLCLSREGVRLFNTRLDVHSATELKSVGAMLEQATHHVSPNNGDQIWVWRSMRWYDDHMEIAFLNSLMLELSPGDFLFIRVGEDSADTETQGYYYDNDFGVCLQRDIVFVQPD